MKHLYLKYFLYLCVVSNFIVSNPNETFLQPKAHESFLCDKITNHEPRAFTFKDMSTWMCVEIDGVFYESCRSAGRAVKYDGITIKRRCLSDKFPNYQFVTYRVAYLEKKCRECGEIKLLKEFSRESGGKDGFRCVCKECRKKHEKEPSILNKRHKRAKERRETDIAYKINRVISYSIYLSLKGKKNGAHWETIAGWTLEEFKAHIESKFTEGMNWDNYGYGKYKWNVDHVIAKCHFDITSNTCQAFKDCWALKNLQPLWQVRNFEKGDKPMHPKYLIKPF